MLQPIDTADLQPGGAIDAAIALVGRNFPSSPPKAATAASPTPANP